MKRIAAILTLLALSFSQLRAWGPKGHAIIADVASSRLSPVTKKNLRVLLGNQSLASISNWADEVRKDRPESFGWHFVDIPKDASGFSEERDCYRPNDQYPGAQTDHHNCIVNRVEMFRQVLADENAPKQDRVEALKFLVHFVGDVHQPLHAVDEARGGNDIKVVVFGSDQCGKYPCTLHGVWDYSLIERAGYSESKYVHHLKHLIRTHHLDSRSGGSVEAWANESHEEARQVLDEHVYLIDRSYWQANIGLVDERLALAGLRLAALLNDTLGTIPTKRLKQDLKKHSST
jgi:S1/P1 Nuclease